MSHTYRYPRPAVSCDCVVFCLNHDRLQILLIQRRGPPFAGQWALPGGFVDIDEDLRDAARRELQEETGLKRVRLTQVETFGAVDRDPRTRVVTVAWYGLLRPGRQAVRAASDAANVQWASIQRLPRLAFDHRSIVTRAWQRLQCDVRCQGVGFELLPNRFTIRQLQTMYETILDRSVSSRQFRRRILALNLLQPAPKDGADASPPGDRWFCLDRSALRNARKRGFQLEI